MKNIIMLFALMMTVGMVSAQEVATKKSCSKAEMKACAKAGKTCSKSAMKTCSKSAAITEAAQESDTNVLAASAAADVLAEQDENITRKECPMSGKVSYFQKSVCSKSGKVSMNEVKYCTKSEAFVNASPSEVMSAEKEAKVIKTADTVDGEVQTATKSAKKACCKKGQKSCSKKTGA